eukprot:jgi/Ulvmu1/10089/UM006_0036.1
MAPRLLALALAGAAAQLMGGALAQQAQVVLENTLLAGAPLTAEITLDVVEALPDAPNATIGSPIDRPVSAMGPLPALPPPLDTSLLPPKPLPVDPSATRTKSTTTVQQRMALAEHTIGINMAFYEAQRAGERPPDSLRLFPQVWEWKSPGYTNVCSEYLATLTAQQQRGVDFPRFPGFFEAGTAVLVTAPAAFVTSQVAIGALQYLPVLANMTPSAALGDPAGCLTGRYTRTNLRQLLLRLLRYMAASLSNSIVVSTDDNSDFAMVTGVADSSTFDSPPYPSWLAPRAYEEKCYVADMDHPAADVAALLANGLAMAAKALATHGTAADQRRARRYGVEAGRAYEYALLMYGQHGTNAVCSRSAAANNCIGSGCTTTRNNGDQVFSVCSLYHNGKDAPEFLFAAAAAMYALTGEARYREDADVMSEASMGHQIFLLNWNNVFIQGAMLLSMEPDVPGAARSRDFYRRLLRESVGLWSECSNDGDALQGTKHYCERTPDGSAYPLDFPWGNLGTTMNAMCAAGVYGRLAFDADDSPLRKDAACFMQRQLGYIFNHKCETRGSSCNTNGTEGFSYMVGIGANYPTKLHSRDASYPSFERSDIEDTGTLCGGIVSGPFAAPTDGPTDTGTDLYENDRRRWQASETAIDYTSSLVCAVMAYATMPDDMLVGCPARTPFTGRDDV